MQSGGSVYYDHFIFIVEKKEFFLLILCLAFSLFLRWSYKKVAKRADVLCIDAPKRKSGANITTHRKKNATRELHNENSASN